ncbi:hypothetical protein [Ferrovibrio sp.]|uniref:hypothetical protein n=1 Tax=Ferrovibrio sp. TaxID=1917215 RepID=UPI003D0EF8AA
MPLDSVTPIITSFAGGEVSPFMYGRQDHKRTYVSAATVENFICLPQGPVDRRGGTRFVAAAKFPDRDFQLVDFEFNDEQAYALECGHLYIRFLMDKAPIVVPATTAAIANGSFAVDLASWTAANVSHAATGGGRAQFASAGLLEQSLAVPANVLHVIACYVGGIVGRDSLTMRVGSSQHGAQYLADRELLPGWHLLAFTPTAGTAWLEFATRAGTAWLDNVVLLDDQPLELVTPFTEAQVQRLGYDQSADVLYLCAAGEQPLAKLQRYGHTSWSLVLVDLIDGPYLPQNGTATTLTPAATTGTDIVVTASAVAGINGGKGFQADDLGRAIGLKHSTTWGWARITEITSTTAVKVHIRTAFGATGAVADWRLGLYTDANGWPLAPVFHEERLVFGGARIRPARLDGSKTGDFETFTPGVNDADAFSYNTGTRKVYWLASTSVLAGGALGGAFVGRTDAAGAPITPTNFQVKANGRASAAAIRPLVLDDVVYLHRHRRKLFAYRYSLEADRFEPTELTLFADHITGTGLRQLAYQEQPFGIIWAARDDGQLVGCTYLPEQDVIAWHRHPLGRSQAADAMVRTLCCIPARDAAGGGADVLYLGVLRVIDGLAVRYIEVLEPPLALDARQDRSFYVDCGLSLENSIAATLQPAATQPGAGVVFTAGGAVFQPGHVGQQIHADWIWRRRNAKGLWISSREKGIATITGYTSGTEVTATIFKAFPEGQIAASAWRLTVAGLTGLDHLEGEVVQILADGAVQPPRAVTAGAITLDVPASIVHVGLEFQSLLKLLPIEAGRFAGNSSKLQRIKALVLRLLRSLGGMAGRSEDTLETIVYRTAADPMNAPEPLLTGLKKIDYAGDWQLSAEVVLAQAAPLPLTLASITPELVVSA